MRNKTAIHVNRASIKAGEELRIVKQAKIGNRISFLFEVLTGENKGFKFWTSDLRPFKTYKTPVNAFLFMLSDYINAGWNKDRLISAGLVPKECKPYLDQFLKYFNKLETAQTI
jgi:hypothetical protein